MKNLILDLRVAIVMLKARFVSWNHYRTLDRDLRKAGLK
jgi:hypothetical protein